MKTKLLLTSVSSAAVCSALVYGLMASRISAIEETLRHTPPVTVVDFVEIASHYPEGADVAELEEVMLKTNKAIVALKDAGYIVIDAAALAAYPEDVAFPADVVTQ